jgi:predicted GNAT family acetyltransferase
MPFMSSADEVRVVDNPTARRYEAYVGDELAGYSQYFVAPGRVVFYHTVVEPQFEGRGIGSRLVRYELDDVRARSLKVTPRCPFVRAFIGRHPGYGDLIA